MTPTEKLLVFASRLSTLSSKSEWKVSLEDESLEALKATHDPEGWSLRYSKEGCSFVTGTSRDNLRELAGIMVAEESNLLEHLDTVQPPTGLRVE